jgi:hypothetical protein
VTAIKSRGYLFNKWQPLSSLSKRRSRKQAAHDARHDPLPMPRQFTRSVSRKPITLHKGPVL